MASVVGDLSGGAPRWLVVVARGGEGGSLDKNRFVHHLHVYL